MSLSAPVTIQVREYIDPTFGGDASPSILTVIIGSRHKKNTATIYGHPDSYCMPTVTDAFIFCIVLSAIGYSTWLHW